MVQPNPGSEVAYKKNRWYEDDHFYAGALAMPGVRGRRGWPAGAPGRALPRGLRDRQPVTTGKVTSRLLDHRRAAGRPLLFTNETNKRLRNDGGGSRSARTSTRPSRTTSAPPTATGPGRATSTRSTTLPRPGRGGPRRAGRRRRHHRPRPVASPTTTCRRCRRPPRRSARRLRFRPRPLPRTFSDVRDVRAGSSGSRCCTAGRGPAPEWRRRSGSTAPSRRRAAWPGWSSAARSIPTVVGTDRYVLED